MTPTIPVLLKGHGGPGYRDPRTGVELQPKRLIKVDVPIELLAEAKTTAERSRKKAK